MTEHNSLTAGQLAIRQLNVCLKSTSISDAAQAIRAQNTSSILIQENNQIIGILTEADSTKLAYKQGLDFDSPVEQFMSSPVVRIKENTVLPEIIMAFHRHRLRHLLVVDEDDNAIGIVSQTDVIKKQSIERYLELRLIKNNFNTRIPVLASNASINDVANEMAQYKSTSAIIFNEASNSYGIVTERDLLKRIALRVEFKDAWHFAAKPIISVYEHDTLYQAYCRIKKNNIRHLVVINEQGTPLGVLSLQHILSDLEIAYVQKLENILEERDSALKASKKHLLFAERIIEGSLDSIMVTNQYSKIMSVNPAFTALTGYTEQEAVGKYANLLSSGQHDNAFYKDMWHSLIVSGSWQGEIVNQKKNGEVYSEWLTIVCISETDDPEKFYAAIFSDITERKENEEKIHALAFYDELTGLPNRRLFNDRFDIALSTAHRNSQSAAVLFLDLDRFKQINDNLGHGVGDKLLKITASRIKSSIKEGDTVSRFGGDEFVILLTEINDPEHVIDIVQRISAVLRRPYQLNNEEMHVTSSIGVAVYPQDGQDSETLLKHADVAMYKAKDSGRNSYQLYAPEMNAVSMEKLLMQNHLRNAITKEEFELHYQIKKDQSNNKIVGLEALLRWNHPELGKVSPAQFIPIAEELGLIVDIDRWVLKKACLQRQEWRRQQKDVGHISVNISALHFTHDLYASVISALNESGLPYEMLDIEVTESCLIKNIESAQKTLTSISQLGVSISLDDFGTGFSSLSYLTQLPFNTLKIDASFIADIPKNSQQSQIVSAIIAMAQGLNLTIVAEGVESTAQMRYLQNSGCHIFQGYLFSKPANALNITDEINCLQQPSINSIGLA